MRPYITILLAIILLGCKKENPVKTNPVLQTEKQEILLNKDAVDSLSFNEKDIQELQAERQILKKEGLIAIEDDISSLLDIVESRSIYKEADEYVLDYTYPHLNEKSSSKFRKFNEYMAESYLNIERTVNQILEDKELLCDTLKIERFRDKRSIDFKLHGTQNNIISILLYKENYYSGMLHSTYMFDCLNYNIDKEEFITFNDFFLEGSDKMIFNLINNKIYNEIHSGEMYYDCWEISKSDFMAYKNNFVINGENIEFYFDDCVICPSYTGQYSVVIPILEIIHLIKVYQHPLLV